MPDDPLQVKRTPFIPSAMNLRLIALLLHRYVGLVLVVFHVVVGLTGALLAYHHQLDRALNPELFDLPSSERHQPLLDPFVLTARVKQSIPAGQHLHTVHLSTEPGRSVSYWSAEKNGEWREWFVSPKTARVLGTRRWGDLAEGKRNWMPYVYRLHYSLALGDTGTLIFGVAALLWTLDCFIGAYLTTPRTQQRTGGNRRSWLARWRPSWAIKTHRSFVLAYTWHRASGLWLWAMLLVFAWSAVGFNLRPVYRPVMRALVGMRAEGHELLPHLAPPYPVPKMSLRDAHRRGQTEMKREALARGFTITREYALYYAEDHGAFAYSVESTLDITQKHPRTEVYLDGNSGRFLGFSAATGISPGNTISSWLHGLHTAAPFGAWYRPIVALLGMAVVTLSVTGAWIWWRKRRKTGAAQVV